MPHASRFSGNLWESDYVLDALNTSQSRTTRDAIAKLRQTHAPPIDFQISNHASQARDAIHAMTSLAYNLRWGASKSAVLQIGSHWRNVVSPWIEFFLADVILVEDWPQTPEGVDLLEKALRIIPLLFSSYPNSELDRLDKIQEMTPFLVPLMTEAWIKVVAYEHPSLFSWSVALDTLSSSRDLETPERYQTISASPQLAKLWIRHVVRESFHIKNEPLIDLKTFALFLVLQGKDTLFEGGKETHINSVVKNSIPAHVRLLSALLSKRKSVRDAALGSEECFNAHALAVAITNYIRSTMERLPQIVEAVRAGFINALLKSYSIYFCCDSEPEKYLDIDHGSQTANILVYVTKFMVYPSVLHAFFRVTGGIRDSEDFVEDLRGKFCQLPCYWSHMMNKAKSLRATRDLFRNYGRLYRCSHQDCEESKSASRFFRCGGCRGTIYCSATCQKLHWDQEHKKECQVITKSLEGGRILSDEDKHFFKELTQFNILRTIPGHINEAVEKYMPSVTDTLDFSEERNSIATGQRNPIIIVDFGLVDLPSSSECIECLDPGVLAEEYQSRLGLEQTTALVERWRGTDADEILIVSLFPKTQTQSWSFDKTFSYPLVNPILKRSRSEIDEDDSDEGSYQSGSGEESETDKGCRRKMSKSKRIVVCDAVQVSVA
ncbi:hypothetical protein PM082_011508 [Marasmius tenuissimus]|nr:hypothetical protein PM082_011508 [Marasmius tenuissimus]